MGCTLKGSLESKNTWLEWIECSKAHLSSRRSNLSGLRARRFDLSGLRLVKSLSAYNSLDRIDLNR